MVPILQGENTNPYGELNIQHTLQLAQALQNSKLIHPLSFYVGSN